MTVIVTTKEELRALIAEEIAKATSGTFAEPTPEPPIKGIHALARFLNVSIVKAQQLKNNSVFPFFQDGRTLYFDPKEVRKVISGSFNGKV